MSKRLVSLVWLSALMLASGPAHGAPKVAPRVCPGLTVAGFEQRVPERVQRFAFAQPMLDPFVDLWRAARRPALPVPPERVTVYALPGKPVLVGYQRGECVIALLKVDRQRLLQWLRPQIGWIT